MSMMNLTKGTVIHTEGSVVQTLEIVLKGKVVAMDGDTEIVLPSGSIIGLFESPGQEYVYTYVAREDSALYGYPFQEDADITKVIKSNPKITATLTTRAVRSAKDFYYAYLNQRDQAMREYEILKDQLAEYSGLCAMVGETPKEFTELQNFEAPSEEEYLKEWQIPFLEAMIENEAVFSKSIYTLGGDVAAGVTMTGVQFEETVTLENIAFRTYRRELADLAKDFRAEMLMIEAKANAIRNVGQEGGEEMPDMSKALDTIMVYSAISSEAMVAFKKLISDYKGFSNRSETSDELRLIRRGIVTHFYDIYMGCFLKSIEEPSHIPPEVGMFLMFGFVDEELAGEENTRNLYRIYRTYTGDPRGNVVTMYEWLQKIYLGEVQPSRNEFDNDYPAALREMKNNGEITQEQEKLLLQDATNKLKFELMNMCAIGNRMTYGRVTTFAPVFDSTNVLRPLDRAFLSPEVLHQQLDEIRGLDSRIFYRDRDYHNEAIGVSHLNVAKEILPYLILMPNMGSRMSMWQEIEGKDRGTAARMIMPIFMIEDLNRSFIAMCGEYRWEMCKSVQGVHWNDITDPSLTSEYSDYIQCFKKNRSLTSDNKEKIQKSIKKVGNNMKRVFVGDYLTYMISESKGSPVMNKVARGILFKYCPFEKSIREALKVNPQYTTLVTTFENLSKQKAHSLEMLVTKMESKNMEVPAEVREQIRYLYQ